MTCHGKVLSCSAPKQGGRRFRTSQALHKPQALEPPPCHRSPVSSGVLGWAEP